MSSSFKVIACPIAFNEENKIGSVVSRFNPDDVDEILVIDDGSTDRTPKIAEEAGARVLRLDKRGGVGQAIRKAIEYARKKSFDIIVITAGNDKDRPAEIPRLLKPIIEDGYEFVQGSRYLPSGDYGNMPEYRLVATKYVHPLLMRIATGRPITDSTNGFRAFKLNVLDHPEIDIYQEWLDAYELEVYILYKVLSLGLKFTEVPVTKVYPEHNLGYTKMVPLVSWWRIIRPVLFLKMGLRK